MELPCLSEKMKTKSLMELHAASPELRSMVGLPVPTLWVGSCSALETAATGEGCAPSIRSWHGGLLSHSKQRRDAIVPSLSRLQKGGVIFHTSFSSPALTCQGNIIWLCLVLKYKLARSHNDEITSNPKPCKGFIFWTCTWGLEYQRSKDLPSFVRCSQTLYPFSVSDYGRTFLISLIIFINYDLVPSNCLLDLSQKPAS